MKRITTTIISAAAAFLALAPVAGAHDFSKTLKDGNTLYFNIIDAESKTVELTYEGKRFNKQNNHPKGEIVVSDFVTHEGVIYKVVAISDRAFYGADSLAKLTLPKNLVEIGDLAFAKCPLLTTVNFGSKQIEFGDDVFYGTENIEEVTFENGWTALDLNLFSQLLGVSEINVPASVRKITNLKTMGSLEAINVSEENTAFSSVDGLLYSKDKKTLYACPVSYKDSVYVAEGTENILTGAFRNCENVSLVSLPVSIRQFNLNEFENLPFLKSLIINSVIPPVTAIQDGEQKFALRLGKEAKVYVPDNALSVYHNVVVTKAGVYSYPGSTAEMEYEADGFVGKKGIKAIKK